jgi:hypothetical protein
MVPSISKAQWVQTNSPYSGNVSRLAFSGTTVFVGSGNGVFRSVNNGGSWIGARSGLMNRNVYSLAAGGPSIFAGKNRQPYKEDSRLSYNLAANARTISFEDSLLYDMYGNLLDDNPTYNKKSPWWQVAIGVAGNNVFTNLVDNYALNIDYARIGFNSWKHNLKTGWEWDPDRFGMNYFFHPYSGGLYFNAARSNGYDFVESMPFALGGSLMWEYFGETFLPSYNDIINTPVAGTFFGEILYRLSSNVLDDRTTGTERFFRELAAAALSPTRFTSRLIQGKLSRVTSEEVYQKEPLNITLSAGVHKVNDGTSFGTGSTSEMFNVHLDYGNPFERRSRKPFDYFKLRTDFSFGVGRKVLDNITGYGILFGKNVQYGNLEMLVGGFQHYNYFDNKTFELGAIAFGGGIISKLPLSMSSNLFSNIHLGIVPFAGNSGRFGPDTSEFRDYNYGGGLEGKLESTLNLGSWAGITFIGYYYWIHTYVGVAGDHFIGLIKPRIAVRLFNNLSIGFEHLVYYSDRYPRDFPSIHFVRTEQKIFLSLYLEAFHFEE